jgi:hypothetical protein
LEAAGIGREGHEDAVGPRLQQVVGEYLHPVGQVLVQLDHALGGAEDDPGLPLIAGHNQDLGALDPVAEQPVQSDGGC